MKTMKLVLCFAVITLLLHSCSKESGKDFDSDYTLYREYISSFSSGIISTKADIQVGLAFTKKEWQVGQELDSDYFSVSPSVEGKAFFLKPCFDIAGPHAALETNFDRNIEIDREVRHGRADHTHGDFFHNVAGQAFGLVGLIGNGAGEISIGHNPVACGEERTEFLVQEDGTGCVEGDKFVPRAEGGIDILHHHFTQGFG